MADKNKVEFVLKALKSEGKNLSEFDSDLSSLPVASQDKIFDSLASQYGYEQKVSVGTTIGRAAAQGASLGFGDELSAAAELGFGKFMDWAKGTEVYKDSTYKELRDVYRQENKAAKKSHPWIYGATEIATSLPAMIGTAGQGSAAGLVAKTGVGALAKVGAVQGGAMALGGAEGGVVNQLVQTALGAVFGAGTGATAGYIGKKLAGRAAEKAARVIDPVDEELASKISSEAAESIVDPAVMQKVTARPPVTPLDDTLAKLGEKDVNVVAYARARGGEKVLAKAPSLDSNVAGGVRNKFDEGMEIVNRKLQLYEKKAGHLIEKSGVKIENAEIVGMIQKEIDNIKGTGLEATEPGKTAIKALEEKMLYFFDKVGKGKKEKLVLRQGTESGQWLRKYLQGLRQENSSFFNKIQAAKAYSTEQKAIENLTNSVDEFLKTNVKGYRTVMAPYSKALRAYKDIEQTQLRQQTADFFTNKVKKPIQDLLLGTRDTNKKWIMTLKNFGEASGIDFIQLVKDRLAYAHLFPGKVTQAEMPSLTQQIGQITKTLTGAITSPGGTATKLATESVPKISQAFNRWRFEKGLQSAVDKVPQSKINRILGTIGTGTDKIIANPVTRSGMINVEAGAVNKLINEQ